jgi:polysaccharide biosynthesis/export protein
MRRARFFILLSAALLTAGCARQTPAPAMAAASDLDTLAYGGRPAAYAATAPAPREPAYTLDSGDRLRVVVYGQDGLTNSYSVDAAGNITMPLIGSVKARGSSSSQLTAAIAAKLRQGYMREPHVAVEIEAYRPFFILGEVTYPGQYPYVADMTVETAVAIAGGFSPRAERYKVEISRNVQGQQVRNTVPANATVKPGDTIVVAERWF